MLHGDKEGRSENHSVISDSLQLHRLYSPWNSPGQNTGVGSHSLLQGILPTQELNWDPLPCRWILYQLSYQVATCHLPNLYVEVLDPTIFQNVTLFVNRTFAEVKSS